MNGLLLLIALITFAGGLVVAPADGAGATLIALPIAALAAFAIHRPKTDQRFLMRLFFSALLVRIFVGTIIFAFHWQDFFGGDAFTYDFFGYALLRTWEGDKYYQMF